MEEQTYSVDHDGYWHDSNKESIPNASGIYCVYSCVYNADEKTVTIKKLIHIGESDDVNSRIANHEKYEEWKKYLEQDEQLCFKLLRRTSREPR